LCKKKGPFQQDKKGKNTKKGPFQQDNKEKKDFCVKKRTKKGPFQQFGP